MMMMIMIMMVAEHMKEIMHNMIRATPVCVQGRQVTWYCLVKYLDLSKTLALGFSQMP